MSGFDQVCCRLAEPPAEGAALTSRNALRILLRVGLLAGVSLLILLAAAPRASWAGPLLALGVVPAGAVELWGERRASSGVAAGLLGLLAAVFSYLCLAGLVSQVGYAHASGAAGPSRQAVDTFLSWLLLPEVLASIAFAPMTPAFLLGLATFHRLRRRGGQPLLETALLALTLVGVPALVVGVLLALGYSVAVASCLVACAAVVAVVCAYGAVLLCYVYFWADFLETWLAARGED